MLPKNPKLKAGLAALGFFWTSATPAEAQEAAPPSLPAPVSDQAPSSATAFAVLLLSNGNVHQGNVSLDKSGEFYLLHQKGGSIRFAKKDIERRFGSIAELYQYKAASVPARDPDERMKLARWCLLYKLNAEARQQLQALLAMNPDDAMAQRMIANLDATADRAGRRDAAVQVAGAEEVMPGPVRPRRASAGPIVIFDLPPALANKRAHEFAWYINPVLQTNCATCHNESYRGEFQLIPGRTNDAIRANLDTALRYTNRENLGQSDLLAYAVNPHGPANARASFRGINDKGQRYLAIWLTSLKPDNSTAKAEPTGKAPSDKATAAKPRATSGDSFGADRLPTAAPAAASLPPQGLPPLPEGIGPRAFYDSYIYEGSAPGVPPGVAFEPVSPLQGGPVPKLPVRPPATPTPAQPPGNPPVTGALPDLPQGTPLPPPDDVIPPSNRPKKTTKIDPARLEKLMKSRQGGDQP